MSDTAPVQGFFTEDMTISVGPQHPSTHGVLRFVVKTDGEVISEAIPDVGYLHRSIEKIGEKVTYHGYVPYTDRADYLAAMFTGARTQVNKVISLHHHLFIMLNNYNSIANIPQVL